MDVLTADSALRPVATALCSMGEGQETEDVVEAEGEAMEGSEIDPFDYLYGDFNPWCGIDAYRHWYGYTDYALLPGLQRFGSVAEAMSGLRSVLAEGPEADERRQGILADMRMHQRQRQHE